MTSLSGTFGGYVFSKTPINAIPTDSVGGYVFGKATTDQMNNVFFGGYTRAPGFELNNNFLGGLVFAQPLTNSVPNSVGGMASGLIQLGPNEKGGVNPRFGGWTFGSPSQTQYVEQHSRTLVKARSSDVVDQDLNLDAQLVLLQRSNDDFNARLAAFSQSNADFNARLNVEAVKLLPSSFMSVTASTDLNGVTQVEVIASGTLFEGGTLFANANIDFGEPYGFGDEFGTGGFANPTYNSSISGFNATEILNENNTISGVHDFNYPGKYIIVASFVDNIGQTTSSAFIVNTITSGILDSVIGLPQEGIDYPALEISGLPRAGLVPPNLVVDFDMRGSGIDTGPVGAAVKRLNSASPVSDNKLSWNFNNGITSTMKQPISTYVNPGFYIPAVRYQFIHPSGTLISASGAGPSGLDPIYEPKPVWISDSLVVGFNL